MTEKLNTKAIRRARQKAGMSLERASQASGLSFNTVSKIELGKSNPTTLTLCKLAAAYSARVVDFYTEEGELC